MCIIEINYVHQSYVFINEIVYNVNYALLTETSSVQKSEKINTEIVIEEITLNVICAYFYIFRY